MAASAMTPNVIQSDVFSNTGLPGLQASCQVKRMDDQPGPNGMPSMSQTISSSVHTTVSATA